MNIETLKTSFFARDIIFGEGLRWHDGRLWMSDMLGCKVYSYDLQGRRETVADVPGKPNGLGFLPDGRLLITSMLDGKLLRREHSGSIVEHADMSPLITGYTGDMAVDAQGRAYVDDVGYRVFEGAPVAPGRLLMVQPDGAVSIQDEPLVFPNGIWISPDRQRLLFAEGRLGRLLEYRFGPDGSLRDKRLIVEYPQKPFDGMTMDRDGGIWICQPYEKRVLRLDGATITHDVRFDALKPVAVCLGGADQKTLFIVAADYTLERMAVNDSRAELHCTRVDVAGYPLV